MQTQSPCGSLVLCFSSFLTFLFVDLSLEMILFLSLVSQQEAKVSWMRLSVNPPAHQFRGRTLVLFWLVKLG